MRAPEGKNRYKKEYVSELTKVFKINGSLTLRQEAETEMEALL